MKLGLVCICVCPPENTVEANSKRALFELRVQGTCTLNPRPCLKLSRDISCDDGLRLVC